MRRGNLIVNLDWTTVFLFLGMLILGWLNIYSAVFSDHNPGILDFTMRYGKQFIWILAALIIAIAIILIDHRFFDFFAWIIFGIAILLLMAVLVAGKEINGAKSWFVLGNIQIQPSEFVKPAVALALAKYLSGFNISIQNRKTLIICSIIIMTPAVLILLQPDTGSALVFSAFLIPLYREGFPLPVILVMFSFVLLFLLVLLLSKFLVLIIILASGLIIYSLLSRSIQSFLVGSVSIGAGFLLLRFLNQWTATGFSDYFVLLISAGLVLLVFTITALLKRYRMGLMAVGLLIASTVYSAGVNYAFTNFLSDYQQRRINILLGFESDPQGAGYNVNQSMIAIGSGGFSGKGYLNGTQTKLHFVPEQSTDFIFCTVGEEWGFIGTFFVVGLFVFLLLRLIILAERQRTSLARIYGYGVISVFFFHFLVNIGMTIGLFPVIGIPLPFFSYGGSSLWAFTVLLFIFLRLDASRMDYLK